MQLLLDCSWDQPCLTHYRGIYWSCDFGRNYPLTKKA
jgi:hypothetical protein